MSTICCICGLSAEVTWTSGDGHVYHANVEDCRDALMAALSASESKLALCEVLLEDEKRGHAAADEERAAAERERDHLDALHTEACARQMKLAEEVAAAERRVEEAKNGMRIYERAAKNATLDRKAAEASLRLLKDRVAEVERRAALPITPRVTGAPSSPAETAAAIAECVRLTLAHVVEPLASPSDFAPADGRPFIDRPAVCCTVCGGAGVLPAKHGPLPKCGRCGGSGEEPDSAPADEGKEVDRGPT